MKRLMEEKDQKCRNGNGSNTQHGKTEKLCDLVNVSNDHIKSELDQTTAYHLYTIVSEKKSTSFFVCFVFVTDSLKNIHHYINIDSNDFSCEPEIK